MKALKGQWVEIEEVLISNRTAKVPEDTKKVPLLSYVQGFVDNNANKGDEVIITTLIGRKHVGRLINVSPVFNHDYGKPVNELLSIGGELKRQLKKENEDE